MRLRSTGFVIVSLILHGLAVTAIALVPRQISEANSPGAEVEVKMGEPSETPGVAEATEPTKIEKPVAEAPTPAVTAPAPAPTPKPVAQAKPVHKARVQKTLPPKMKSEPIEAKADDSDAPAVVVPDAAPTEEQPEMTPVKEVADGVEADKNDDKQTEAASQDVKKAQEDVAPAPAETAAAAAASAPTPAPGQDLGKGGATQAGAVEYTDLKQTNGNKPPVYPMAARLEKRQGQVELLYRVTKDGHVTEVSVAQSSGSQDLDQEAVRAISKFHFVPGQEGWAKHPVVFSLKGETAALPSRLRSKVGSQE